MKRLLLIIVMGLAFMMLYAQEETDGVSDEKTKQKREFLNEISYFWGVAITSLSSSKTGEVKYNSANGFMIGVRTIVDDFDSDLFIMENGWQYWEQNYMVDNNSTISRGLLGANTGLGYKAHAKLPTIYFGSNFSKVLTGSKPNKTFVNDIPLIFGIGSRSAKGGGIRYNYSHGTYSQKIYEGHKSKINTLSEIFMLAL